MVAIEKSRAVRREVGGRRGERLVVTLTPEGAWIREKGRRISYLMPYGYMLREAAEAYARAEKARKAKERKERAALRRKGLL